MSKLDITDAILGAERLTDVMARMPVSINAALAPEREIAMLSALCVCLKCRNGESCDAWITNREEGGITKAPAFCPNAVFFDSIPHCSS